jgi:hypothetical protein
MLSERRFIILDINIAIIINKKSAASVIINPFRLFEDISDPLSAAEINTAELTIASIIIRIKINFLIFIIFFSFLRTNLHIVHEKTLSQNHEKAILVLPHRFSTVLPNTNNIFIVNTGYINSRKIDKNFI